MSEPQTKPPTEYVTGTSTSASDTPDATAPEAAKRLEGETLGPFPKVDLHIYGVAKPERRIIRGKVFND